MCFSEKIQQMQLY